MCDCLAEANAKLEERNGEILTTIWPVVRPIIATQKVDSKKRGRPAMMVASFCPFCGVQYPTGELVSAA